MARQNELVDLGIRGLSADVGTHIAYFWETGEEFREAVGFLDAGLRGGDHVVIFGHDEANAAVRDEVETLGWNCDALEAEGRLSVVGLQAEGDLMLSRIGATFQRAMEGGSQMIRLLGNIGWGRSAWPDERDILRFEAKVTAAAASFPCVVICMYDVNTVSGPILMHGAFETHPLTIHHNLIRENPVCLDVEEYLARLDALEAQG